MKSLYIVGNGFDLAHGLPTHWRDFRMYLEATQPYFLKGFEALYDIQALDDTEPWYTKKAQAQWDKSVRSHRLWSEFEQGIGDPNTTEILNFSDCILEDLSLDGGNIGIRETMDVYWRQKFGFIDDMQTYVKEWIEQIDTSRISCRKKALIGSKDHFLSFNYTDTLERVYHIDNVLHIHGGVHNGSDIPPIIGHNNIDGIWEYHQWSKEADERYEEGEASIQEAIAQYLKAIYKDTDHIIFSHSDFFDKLQDVNHVIIIGWSAGNVDIPYLKNIKESVSKNTKWTVYWYNDMAYHNLFSAFSAVGINNNDIKYEQSDRFWD